MPTNQPVDRHALHRFLWERRSRRDTIRVVQQELADGLGVNKWTMSRIMHELQDDGRIKPVGIEKGTIRTFVVRDPAEWEVSSAAC